MSNLALGAANKNFFAGRLHDTQGSLSEVGERRGIISFIMSTSESGTNYEAEAEDKGLEGLQKQLETQEKLEEGLYKASEDITKQAAKGAGGRFSSMS